MFYFDPLGKKLTNKYIKIVVKKLKKFNIKFKDFKNKIQSDESNFCGFFCIAFLIAAYKNKIKQFFSIMDKKDLNKNDNLCIKFISYHIKNEQ